MRLDKYLSGRIFTSRTKAARAIAEGRVFLNGTVAKASDEVGEGDEVTVREKARSFVSEGGFKLQKGLDDFSQSVEGCVCVDLGASTGGFTDCLLQAGAKTVFAVDVGKDQLDVSLRKDPRVYALDGINVRYLQREQIPAAKIDVVTADLSFISLKLIFPVIQRLLSAGGRAFVLVKPQFECGGVGLDKHGIVKDREKRLALAADLAREAASMGLMPLQVTAAPLRKNKNVEYILLFEKSDPDLPGEQFQAHLAALD